jgi:YgiT-type zinc finger domain-containing protein
MECALCKGNMVEKRVAHTIETDTGIIVIRDVPALVCNQCGEVWFSSSTQQRLEKILHAASDSTAPEVAVFKYSRAA